MEQPYSWQWVEGRVAETIRSWNSGAAKPPPMPRYSPEEQEKREKGYDQGLHEVEQEAKKTLRTRADRLAAQDRITSSFARFSATALNLESGAVQLLTEELLPVGTELARFARQFDPNLDMADIIQACRNAWTACGLQPLLGQPIKLTPSILGYSLLYPYSDNFLDREDVPNAAKLRFSERFRNRLHGIALPAEDDREAALWTLVGLIEQQYARAQYPHVFACLLAIHRAQEESITQTSGGRVRGGLTEIEILRTSCAKGGTSVLADACLAHGCMSREESRFAFAWGVLLQLGDDLQDIREDMRRGSVTLFTQAATSGRPLDSLVIQLLNFSMQVAAGMEHLLYGTAMLKKLLRMSWQSLIVGAIANSHEFFSPAFLAEAEGWSPFRFDFLRARNARLASRQGLYARLFEAFLEPPWLAHMSPKNGYNELGVDPGG
ncbi:MAG: hypothetical protein WA510_14075 [Acidobacteriaceae bacterium]